VGQLDIADYWELLQALGLAEACLDFVQDIEVLGVAVVQGVEVVDMSLLLQELEVVLWNSGQEMEEIGGMLAVQ